jgi:hypothetical protein
MSAVDPKNVPDPNGPPVAREPTGDMWRMAGSISIKVVVGGIATFAVLAVVATPTSGALRSHRVQWEQRQKEVASAQEAECGPPAEPKVPADATAPQELPHD